MGGDVRNPQQINSRSGFWYPECGPQENLILVWPLKTPAGNHGSSHELFQEAPGVGKGNTWSKLRWSGCRVNDDDMIQHPSCTDCFII